MTEIIMLGLPNPFKMEALDAFEHPQSFT